MNQASDCRKLEMQTLEALSRQPDRPAGLEPFERFFREGLREKELAGCDAPLVGQFCNFVPEELVLAAGATPLRLDLGCHFAAREGAKRLQAEVCCAVRSLAGAFARNDWPTAAVDLVVIATSCDGKEKLAAQLASEREVFVLELPRSNRGELARERWRVEIHRLIDRLQKLSGRRVTRRTLRQAVELVNRRAALGRRMNGLRKAERPPINGADALMVMQAGFLADVRWWVEKTEILVKELEERMASRQGVLPSARILLTGSPVLWPDFKLPLLVVECGADIVADEICSGTQRIHHPALVDEWTKEGLIRAVGERVLLPCTCPCFFESDGRLDRLRELSEGHRVDGIIHHTLRLCQLYDMDAAGVAKFFKQRELPWLEINAEFGPEDAGRMRSRIEAFVEMLTAVS